MLSYRIKRWADVPHADKALAVRRAVTAMSVGWVTRHWLAQSTRLNERGIDSLLAALDDAGVLEVAEDFGPADPTGERPSSSAGSLLRDLLARIGRDALRSVWWAIARPLRRLRASVVPGAALTIERQADRPAVMCGLPSHDVQLIADALRARLDGARAARHVLADLARLETALRLHGPSAVDDLPESTLRWALSQLGSLNPGGCLRTLQQRLESAVQPAPCSPSAVDKRSP